ncbi:MAG TPA: Hsp20/alpha crystallin family protein [bacterium]|nr:Hsp20/alpha crystallin family protein [bacterium]
MNIQKKIISFLLFSAMVASGIPAATHAAGAEKKNEAAAPAGKTAPGIDEEEYYSPDDPFIGMRHMQRVMNRMFDRMTHENWPLGTAGAAATEGFYAPDLDTYETAAAFVVECDLPGMEKDKIDVSVDRNVLTISGIREKKAQHEEKKEGYVSYRESVSYGQFSRSVRLPDYIDPANYSASFTNGVLKIEFPKKQAESKKVKINIK